MKSRSFIVASSMSCALLLASCASTPAPQAATDTAVATTEPASSDAASAATPTDKTPETSDIAQTETTQDAAPEDAETKADNSGVNPVEPSTNPNVETVEVAPAIPEQPIEVPVEPELTPVQKMMADGDFAGARALALQNLKSGKTQDSAEFWAVVENDPMLSHTLDQEVRPHGTNTISALGGGSTVSFKYKDTADDTAKAALKPDQDLRQTMYRSGIAYYRICQILGCSFDTPVTRPARFSKADFNTLYNASDSNKNKGYRAKFEHLIWAKEEGTTYLYVGYKEWISPFTSFPIEVTSAWSPYLKNPDKQQPEVRAFLKTLLSGGREGAVKDLDKLTEYAKGMTTRDLLRQISDVILLDYLTNNWDRFAGDQSNFGANCHFQPGGIIAIDNDAAFPAWHAPRVVRRLNLVESFSREFVENLRLLDPDELLIHLFPNPTKEEKKSFERFKERRRDALKYIDALIQKKGEDKVLVF